MGAARDSFQVYCQVICHLETHRDAPCDEPREAVYGAATVVDAFCVQKNPCRLFVPLTHEMYGMCVCDRDVDNYNSL